MSTLQTLEMETNINTATDANTDQFLTFMLSDEEYGVDILRVQEIRGWGSITAIPDTPEYIKGIINIRGTIVPIIDLRERFGLESISYGTTTVVIVLKVMSEDKERVMGIIVDAVSDVYNVLEEDMKEAPDFGGSISVDFVKSLAAVEDKMLILLDIDRLLNSGELEIMDTDVA